MNEAALSVFVEQVLTDARQKFGPNPDRIWLENYAREAVLDLWLDMPEITFFTAYKAYLLLRKAIAQQDEGAGDLAQLGDCACAGEVISPSAAGEEASLEWLMQTA
ncbi:MAG: hypothetical protein ACJ789_05915 [Thermomicrobiales bacterium]|jgi:hypothetical protein